MINQSELRQRNRDKQGKRSLMRSPDTPALPIWNLSQAVVTANHTIRVCAAAGKQP